MHTAVLPRITRCSILLLTLLIGCSSSTGDDEAELGSGGTDAGTGGAASGGTASGGAASGGTASGGAASGGAASGGAASGGGDPGTGGADAATGGSGTGGDSMDGGPVGSMGCGQMGTLSSGVNQIRSSNLDREYTLDIPDNYDDKQPYRLIFTWHWINASDEAVATGQVSNGGASWAYYGLKKKAQDAGEPAIFVAPQSRNGRWDELDHVLFEDILAAVEANLCIDTDRVFSTGFSFGGMQTYSLSTSHQSQLRAVSALSPANFNIYLPTNTHEPIAYMSATGMSDTLTPWDGGNNRGARYAALGHAEDNGCTIPDEIPTANVGSKSHVCYDFEGCDEGYPVKVCTFDGGHIAAHADGGTGDNGTTTWESTVTWEFFSQF